MIEVSRKNTEIKRGFASFPRKIVSFSRKSRNFATQSVCSKKEITRYGNNKREHTLEELLRQEKVRNFLLAHHIIDTDSFVDYLAELE